MLPVDQLGILANPLISTLLSYGNHPLHGEVRIHYLKGIFRGENGGGVSPKFLISFLVSLLQPQQ